MSATPVNVVQCHSQAPVVGVLCT